jgi:hypothetical protein
VKGKRSCQNTVLIFFCFPQSFLTNILEKFATSFDLNKEDASSTLTQCRICVIVTTMNCQDNRKS